MTERQRMRPEARGSATIADVARRAGVSPSTVSRALNEPGLVKAQTIAAVRAAIAEIGYTPNLLAGALASSRTLMVAVIVPSIENSIFSDTVNALSERLSAEGYQTFIGLSGYAPEQEEALINAIISRRPDAIVLTGVGHTPASRARLQAAGIPLVETWDISEAPLDMAVGFSHTAVGQAIGRYLIGRGYRRFGFISGGDPRACTRQEAVCAELAARGLPEPATALVGSPTKVLLGREGLARLLAAETPPEVVVCSSDALAYGALAEAQSRGVRAPHDLAVMGFGDLNFSAHTSPPLSTVRIDGRLIGERCAEALLARLRPGREAPPAVLDVGFSIVERGST